MRDHAPSSLFITNAWFPRFMLVYSELMPAFPTASQQGVGPYTKESKKLEQDIQEMVKKVNDMTGTRTTSNVARRVGMRRGWGGSIPAAGHSKTL